MRLTEHSDSTGLITAVADQLGAIIDEALQQRGRAVLVLAGGKTPLPLYRALAAQSRDWSRVIVLPSDERWVDAGHPARNEDEIAEAMQAARGLDLRPLVPLQAEHPPLANVAEQSLADLSQPFDAVVLGMGMDAHTASLFPNATGLSEAMAADAEADAFVVQPDPLPVEAPYARITLGRRRLANARRHFLLITGVGKLDVLQRAMHEPETMDAPVCAFLAAELNMTVHWSP